MNTRKIFMPRNISSNILVLENSLSGTSFIGKCLNCCQWQPTASLADHRSSYAKQKCDRKIAIIILFIS